MKSLKSLCVSNAILSNEGSEDSYIGLNDFIFVFFVQGIS